MDDLRKEEPKNPKFEVETAEHIALVVCSALGIGFAIYLGANLLFAEHMSAIGRLVGLGILISSPLTGICVAPIFRGFLWPIFALLYHVSEKR